MIWTETAKDILIEAERGYDVSVWSPWKHDLEGLHHELCVQLWIAGVEFDSALSTLRLRVAYSKWGCIRLVSGREGLRGVHTDVLYTTDLTSWDARITVMGSRARTPLRHLPIRTAEGDLE